MGRVNPLMGMLAAVLVLSPVWHRTAGQEHLPEPERVFQLPLPEPLERDSSLILAAPAALPVRGNARPAWHEAITNLPGDWVSAGELAVAPASLPALAGVAALTGALLFTDRETNRFSIHLTGSSPFVRGASDAVVHAGDGAIHLGVAAAFGAYGFLADDSRALRTASQTVEALLATGITVQVLKRVSGRESPATASTDRGRWRPFPNLKLYQKNQPKYYAFPSGHMATTVATLTVIAENYPEQRWIRPVGYTLLAGLGVSLVNVGYHWYSDLPLGAAVGYAFGMLASRKGDASPDAARPESAVSIMVLPSLQQDGAGVTLALRF
jgi:membrane-associated phospholipid phosphatase